MIEGYTNRLYADVKIEPKPTPRPRLGKGGNIFNESWYTGYKSAVAKQIALQTGGVLIETPCAISIVFIKTNPATSKRYGDIDNLAKGVLDSLIGVVLADDSLVTELRAKKCQSAEPSDTGFHVSIYY